MSDLLTINVKNMMSVTKGFYFFQQPAVSSGGGQVFSNSLFSMRLGNYEETGAILTFQAKRQNYACIQEAHGRPQVGQASGYASASRAIDLASASGNAEDTTTASVSPLGLSQPAPVPASSPGRSGSSPLNSRHPPPTMWARRSR